MLRVTLRALGQAPVRFRWVQRDIFQSLGNNSAPLPLRQEQLKLALQVGLFSQVEIGGGQDHGATVQHTGDRDAFDNLAALAAMCQAEQVQTSILLRGANLTSFRPFSLQVQDRYVRLLGEAGVSICKVFDASNNCGMMQPAVEAVLKYGMTPQIAICMTQVQSVDFILQKFVQVAQMLQASGIAPSQVLVDFKSMAGTDPYGRYTAIAAAFRSGRLERLMLDSGVAPEVAQAFTAGFLDQLTLHVHSDPGGAMAIICEAVDAGLGSVDVGSSYCRPTRPRSRCSTCLRTTRGFRRERRTTSRASWSGCRSSMGLTNPACGRNWPRSSMPAPRYQSRIRRSTCR